MPGAATEMIGLPVFAAGHILRAEDACFVADLAYDTRMNDAIEVLLKKRRSDRKWPLQAKHPGKTHFDMEQAGKPSRWNTLRALRVLKHFNIYVD